MEKSRSISCGGIAGFTDGSKRKEHISDLQLGMIFMALDASQLPLPPKASTWRMQFSDWPKLYRRNKAKSTECVKAENCKDKFYSQK
jgi:hypothetical protein